MKNVNNFNDFIITRIKNSETNKMDYYKGFYTRYSKKWSKEYREMGYQVYVKGKEMFVCTPLSMRLYLEKNDKTKENSTMYRTIDKCVKKGLDEKFKNFDFKRIYDKLVSEMLVDKDDNVYDVLKNAMDLSDEINDIIKSISDEIYSKYSNAEMFDDYIYFTLCEEYREYVNGIELK